MGAFFLLRRKRNGKTSTCVPRWKGIRSDGTNEKKSASRLHRKRKSGGRKRTLAVSPYEKGAEASELTKSERGQGNSCSLPEGKTRNGI